jgi:hypothetical protein
VSDGNIYIIISVYTHNGMETIKVINIKLAGLLSESVQLWIQKVLRQSTIETHI